MNKYKCGYPDCKFESERERGPEWEDHNSLHFLQLAAKHEKTIIQLTLDNKDEKM